MLSVKPLHRVPEQKATIRAWLLSEWPDWYGPGGVGNLDQDIAAFASSERALPIGFVVFRHDQPIGFGSLKQQSIPTHTHLAPWAASGLVAPESRLQGVGAFLLREMVAHAARLGFSRVYCGTSTAESLLARNGWQLIEQVVHAGKPLSIYCSVA